MICFAKGVTSGTVPMGGVIARKHIYDAFMKGPEHMVELFHGYTYSAHPLACAAGLATLSLYEDEQLFENARRLEEPFADAIHALKGLPNVVDIRTIGLAGAIDLAPKSDGPGKRGYEAMEEAFHRQDMLVRVGGDTLVLCPPLMATESQIGEIADKAARAIRAVA
jgi:beta-alanine--pyruvate transaminase